MTRINSIFEKNPNKKIIEDRVQTDEVGTSKIKLIMIRIKIALYLINWITKMDGFIHQNWYPRFTKIVYALLMAILYYFDPTYTLSYIVLILFLVVFSYS